MQDPENARPNHMWKMHEPHTSSCAMWAFIIIYYIICGIQTKCHFIRW